MIFGERCFDGRAIVIPSRSTGLGTTVAPANPNVRQSRNRTVFQPADQEYFLPDETGGADVLRAVLLSPCAHSGKFRATARRRTCPTQFSIEDTLPNEAWRKRRLQ